MTLDGAFVATVNDQASFPKLVTDCALSLLYTAHTAAREIRQSPEFDGSLCSGQDEIS